MPWTPLHANHAIEQVVITISFNEPVTSKLLQSVAQKMRPVASAKGLATNVELKGFAVTIGGGPGAVAPSLESTSAPGGYAFQRQSHTGALLEALQIMPTEIKHLSSEYRRWSDFKRRMEDVLFPTLEDISASVDVREVKMEYFDQFSNNDPSPSLSDLLRADSKYLPRFVEAERGSFHCHVGRFEKFDERERRLINLNVDAFDAVNPSRRVVRILTLAADSAPQGALSGTVAGRLDELHILLKGMMLDTITPATAGRIALNVQA